MARKILIAVALVVVGLVVLISLLPNAYSVQRSATISGTSAAVFGQINDLAAWDGWSPWKSLDPNAKTTISAPSDGNGATFTWSGNDEIGEGSLTILESRPHELVEVEQSFVRPFEGKTRMTFSLAPDGSGTKVTWTMNGTNNFIGKAMCMVMNMDTMLGSKFEVGLRT